MHAKKEVLYCKFLIFNNCNFVCFRVFLLYTSIELDSGILSFQKLDEENEDLTLILGKKMEIFADTSAFNAGVKEKNTKTNKITIVKNQKLAIQNFLFNMHINFPFGNIAV
jgi:hypothetical protein